MKLASVYRSVWTQNSGLDGFFDIKRITKSESTHINPSSLFHIAECCYENDNIHVDQIVKQRPMLTDDAREFCCPVINQITNLVCVVQMLLFLYLPTELGKRTGILANWLDLPFNWFSGRVVEELMSFYWNSSMCNTNKFPHSELCCERQEQNFLVISINY